jgi:hypothetical protein
MRRHGGTFAAIVAIAVLGGCGEPSPEAQRVQEKLGETWDAMKAWGVAKKAELVQKSGPMLESAKQKMAGAKGEAAKALQVEWADVEAKFATMKNAGADQWESARDAFLQAYETFKKKVGD